MNEWAASTFRMFGYKPPRRSLLCRIFGHRWIMIDRAWTGTDTVYCPRCKLAKSQPTPERA